MKKFGIAFTLAGVAVLAAYSETDYSRFNQPLSKDQEVLHALTRLTFGPRPGDVEAVRKMGLKKWIDLRNESSLDIKVNAPIDLFFSDSAIEIREQEVRHFLPQMGPDGLILMHDASSHLKTVRQAALKMEEEGLISVLLLPTPRGLVLAQRR